MLQARQQTPRSAHGVAAVCYRSDFRRSMPMYDRSLRREWNVVVVVVGYADIFVRDTCSILRDVYHQSILTSAAAAAASSPSSTLLPASPDAERNAICHSCGWEN